MDRVLPTEQSIPESTPQLDRCPISQGAQSHVRGTSTIQTQGSRLLDLEVIIQRMSQVNPGPQVSH